MLTKVSLLIVVFSTFFVDFGESNYYWFQDDCTGQGTLNDTKEINLSANSTLGTLLDILSGYPYVWPMYATGGCPTNVMLPCEYTLPIKCLQFNDLSGNGTGGYPVILMQPLKREYLQMIIMPPYDYLMFSIKCILSVLYYGTSVPEAI